MSELVAKAMHAVHCMTDDQRREFLAAFDEDFCLHCGRRHPEPEPGLRMPCPCWNDD